MKDNIETYPDNEILQNMKCIKNNSTNKKENMCQSENYSNFIDIK